MCAAESVEQAGAGHIGRWNSSIKVNSDVERLFCKARGHMQCVCVGASNQHCQDRSVVACLPRWMTWPCCTTVVSHAQTVLYSHSFASSSALDCYYMYMLIHRIDALRLSLLYNSTSSRREYDCQVLEGQKSRATLLGRHTSFLKAISG